MAGYGGTATASAWTIAMLDQGQRKSEEYWTTYKETPLEEALDPAKGILAFPPPPHPALPPSEWLGQADQRLHAGVAAASKPLHESTHVALCEASARSEWLSMNASIAELERERAAASVLRPGSADAARQRDPRSLLERSSIEVPEGRLLLLRDARAGAASGQVRAQPLRCFRASGASIAAD